MPAYVLPGWTSCSVQLYNAVFHSSEKGANFAGRGPTMGQGEGIRALSKVDLDNPEKHWEKFHHTLKNYQVCFHLDFCLFETREFFPLLGLWPIH